MVLISTTSVTCLCSGLVHESPQKSSYICQAFTGHHSNLSSVPQPIAMHAVPLPHTLTAASDGSGVAPACIHSWSHSGYSILIPPDLKKKNKTRKSNYADALVQSTQSWHEPRVLTSLWLLFSLQWNISVRTRQPRPSPTAGTLLFLAVIILRSKAAEFFSCI